MLILTSLGSNTKVLRNKMKDSRNKSNRLKNKYKFYP